MLNIKPLFQYDALADFLEAVKDEKFFQPDLTMDLYYGLWFCKRLVAIGFVRGWEGKWPEKVLGVAVLPGQFRRKGFGTLLVSSLEVAARKRGVDVLRLHVHPENKPAIAFYCRLGYVFTGETRENGEMVGRKNLKDIYSPFFGAEVNPGVNQGGGFCPP